MKSEGVLSIDDAKKIDLIYYMNMLGLQPTRVSGNSYWFLSPFPDRSERTASMKVDRHKNTWKDFGDGRGGSIIDFVMRYNRCNISVALNILSGKSATVPAYIKEAIQDDPSTHIQIIADRVIVHPYLVNYLHERRISLHIANQYCREIDITLKNKQYTAVGFKNNFGGYEIRNKYFKGSSSPKDVTLIDSGSSSLKVFEGFIDFLSHQVIYHKQACAPANFLVLNSLSFVEGAKRIMENYNQVELYLDNDERGKAATKSLVDANVRYMDRSDLYKNYPDLNEMLMTIGLGSKTQHQLGRKL